MRIVKKTFCRTCTSCCGMDLVIENNRIISARGNKEHPISEGYFCVKGALNAEFTNGAEGRLLRSVKRGDDGEYSPIDAVQAVEEIGDRLTSLIEQYGPRSVALYYGTAAYPNSLATPLIKSWMHEIGSPNLFSSMTIDQSARWVTLLRMGMLASGKPDPEDADVLMVVGNNPVVSHQNGAFGPRRKLRRMKARGVKIIVVDPRRSETAQYADLHLPITPGEDAALFAGMIRLILEKGWEDKEFCGRFAEGVEALRAAVSEYTPGYVAARTGIDLCDFETATQWFSTSKRSLAVHGTGPCMVPHSNLAHHLLEALNVLCGNYRRAGDLVKNPGVFFPRGYSERVIPSNRSWEHGVKCRTRDTGKMFGEFPTGLLPDEILQPGVDKIRALIVVGGNPLMALGQPDKTRRAFADLELLVAIDPRMNETAAMAHYVVAPTVTFERHDVSALDDGALIYPRPFAQYAPPLVTRPEGTIDEWEFYFRLAQRMGLQLTFKKMITGMDYAYLPGGFPMDMRRLPGSEELVRLWCEGTAVDFETLCANPSGVLVDLPEATVQPAADDGARLSLCPDDIAAELHAVRLESPSDQFKFRMGVRRLLETMNGAYRDSDHTRKRYPTNRAYIHPDDLLDLGVTGGDAVIIESALDHIIGIAQADPNQRRGAISMSHMWGVITMSDDPNGLRGAHTGRLVSMERDCEPINHMPVMTGIPVNVRRWIAVSS
jgi:anaerobic selenocysteine-containing dehydrogenase